MLELPDLIAVQRESFRHFVEEGVAEVLADISPIEDFTGTLKLELTDHVFDPPKHSEDECRERDMTYARPLFVTARFMNATTGEIKEQTVFMGDFPMMTDRGTFIINGTERIVVSQLVRSPGVYFNISPDKTQPEKDVVDAKVIPGRGAWLEFEVDKKDIVFVRIDRKRKQPVTILLKALGFGESPEELATLILDPNGAPYQSMLNTLDKDNTENAEAAFIDIYRKLRPGEPPTPDSARQLLENLFFNPKRYDMAKVGRHKVGKKLADEYKKLPLAKYQLKAPNADPEKGPVDYQLSRADILATVSYLVKLHNNDPDYYPDDIDHFGNRRVRSVGELLRHLVATDLRHVVALRVEEEVLDQLTGTLGRRGLSRAELAVDVDEGVVGRLGVVLLESETHRLVGAPLIVEDQVQQLFVRLAEAERLQEHGHGLLALAVDTDVDDVLLVDLELEPRTT